MALSTYNQSTGQCPMHRLPLSITPALDVAIGDVVVSLTPRQGLALAEDLARKAFRRVMAEEAERHGVPLDAPRERPRQQRQRPEAA